MPSEQGQMSAHCYFQEVAQNGLEMEAKMKVEKPRICLISDLITIDTLNWEILCCGRLGLIITLKVCLQPVHSPFLLEYHDY